MPRIQIPLILLLAITACTPSGPDPEIQQKLRFEVLRIFTNMAGHWAATNEWPSLEKIQRDGYQPAEPGFTVEIVTRQWDQKTNVEGGFVATVTHTASGQCLRLTKAPGKKKTRGGCDEPLPEIFTQPPPAPPSTPPSELATAQSGEMLPLGVGGDLDAAHEKGKCSMLGMKDETSAGGEGEMPKGSYKKFGCRDQAGLQVEWTMCVSESCGKAKVYMLTVTVPRINQFKNALVYLKAFSPPKAMREWGKVKLELKTMPLAVLRSGPLKLFAMPAQAGPKAGQLVMILTAPGAE